MIWVRLKSTVGNIIILWLTTNAQTKVTLLTIALVVAKSDAYFSSLKKEIATSLGEGYIAGIYQNNW
jgi:hypothetical protein